MNITKERCGRALIGVLFFWISACGDTEINNSFSRDAEYYRVPEVIDTSTDAGARFSAAREVFSRKCTSCHLHSFHTYSETEISDPALNWILPGDAASSPLYLRLKGSGGARADMPSDASLSDEDRQVIQEWIDGMGAL